MNKGKKKNPFASLPIVKLDLPKFANEAEEANWWLAHRREADEHFAKVYRAGGVRRVKAGVLMPATKQTTIRLIENDVARARAIAERKGLRYQTYIKMVVHEAIERDERRAKPARRRG